MSIALLLAINIYLFYVLAQELSCVGYIELGDANEDAQ